MIRNGDLMAQLWAIRLLGQRDDPVAVELLRDAMQGPSRDVQLAAAAALGRTDDRHSARVIQAETRTTRTPNDAAGWRMLGDAWRAYADCGLLPVPLARRALLGAMTAYQTALSLDSTCALTKESLAHLLIALERHGEAEPLLRERLNAAPTPEAESALATLLFGQRRWSELRELARASVATGRRDPVLEWWATI
jgi:HEAT repeat protein